MLRIKGSEYNNSLNWYYVSDPDPSLNLSISSLGLIDQGGQKGLAGLYFEIRDASRSRGQTELIDVLNPGVLAHLAASRPGGINQIFSYYPDNLWGLDN